MKSADAVVEDEECPICFDVLTDAVVTPCTHVFCRECLGMTFVGVLHFTETDSICSGCS